MITKRYGMRWREHGRWVVSAKHFNTPEEAKEHAGIIGCGASRWELIDRRKKDWKPRKPLVNKTRMVQVSKKGRSRMERYLPIRKAYLAEHRHCMVEGCGHRSLWVHHMRGRQGERLFDTREFMAVCTPCHFKIENDREWARDQGYLKDRIGRV